MCGSQDVIRCVQFELIIMHIMQIIHRQRYLFNYLFVCKLMFKCSVMLKLFVLSGLPFSPKINLYFTRGLVGLRVRPRP